MIDVALAVIVAAMVLVAAAMIVERVRRARYRQQHLSWRARQRFNQLEKEPG